MKRKAFKFISVVLITFLFTGISYGQTKKLAQTGMKFLNVSTNAHNAGMADAITSIHGNSSSMLYNPSAMAEIESNIDVSFNQANWIADIGYISATAAYKPFGGELGVFGFSMVSVDYGDFRETVRATNNQGYIDLGTYSPSAVSIGIGYAKALSQKFSIGGNIKYVRQSLIGNGKVGLTEGGYESEKFEANTLAFDFGLIYKIGFESLNIGMSVRNFSQEIKFIEEGFQLPLIFQLGISMDVLDLFEIDKSMHSLLVSVDASHPRDYPEQNYFGLNYTFMNSLSFRAGYNGPRDDGGITAGIGVKQEIQGIQIGVDYAYEAFDIFEDVHRFSIRFGY